MNSKTLLPLMKKTVALTAATACAFATLSLSNTANAKTVKKNSSHSSSSNVIRLNPKNLRIRLLEGDTSIMIGMNQVVSSKVQVASTSAALLPSANISAGLGPSFFLQSFSVLLPFLLPSNWANLSASEANLAATGFGYYALELNEMANAYTIFQTIVNDMDAHDVYVNIYNNYQKIQDFVQSNVDARIELPVDLDTAKANTRNAQGLVRHADELIAQEIASVRMMLGIYDLDTKFEFDRTHMAALAAESSSAQSILDNTYAKSPERAQMLSLIQAAKAQKISAAFSFLTNAQIAFGGSGTGSGGITSFNNAQGSGSAQLSFTIFPLVQQAQVQIEQYQIRLKQVRLQEGQLVESSLHSTRDAAAQFDFYSKAEANAQSAFNDTLTQYQAHVGDLDHVNIANNTLQTASLNRVSAQLDLDNQRITLTRELIAGQFANIRSCRLAGGAAPNAFTGFFSNVAGIFSLEANKLSIDQLCKN